MTGFSGKKSGFIGFALLILFLAGLSTGAFAQEKQDFATIQKELETTQKDLEKVEPTLLDTALDNQKLFDTRQNVKQIRARLTEILDLIKPLSITIKADIVDIGAPPSEESAEAEPDNIKELREKLNKELLLIQGVMAHTEALSLKSTRLLEKLAAIRRNQFVNQILEKNLSPFSSAFWLEALSDKDQGLFTISENLKTLFPEDSENTKRFYRSLSVSVLVFLAVFIAIFIASTIRLKRKIKSSEDPSLGQKLAYSGYATLYSVIAGSIGLSIILLVFDAHGILTEQTQLFAYKIFLLGLFIVFALTKSWMLSCSGAVRKIITLMSVCATALFSLDFFLLETSRQFNVSVEVAIAQSFIVTSIFATLLLVFSLSLIKIKKDESKTYLVKRKFYYFVLGLGVFIIIANALGYVALTRFVFEQSVLLTNFAFALIMIRAMIKPVLVRLEQLVQQKSEKDEHILLFWLTLLIDIILLTVSSPIIAAIIGVEWEGIKLLIFQSISGIKIGGITISLTSMAAAIILFIVLLTMTRLVQKVLAKKILTKTRMAESVRLSIVQIVGYIGLTISFMAAISSVGFDLSNLALIAGALSVGIGFGLQSIVSNFVSGLILLFERPIKVGDWVAVSSGEGYVKKISVRATEIETFDRSSIIIPNSELISSSVKNWTLKDRIGRLIITVGVSYNCDPHRVYDLLLEIAEKNNAVISSPAPSVYFKDFGDNALIFDLRVFLRNITDQYKVATELRMAIWDKLKAEGIEIPFPQRDLHIRSSDVPMNVITPDRKQQKA